MNINRQTELILQPGDRIWYKSSIYGDKYYDAVIQEIFPGPGRTIRTDVFESPKSFTILQKYELKNGEKVNLLPPEGRIMMRYWTLEPGVHETANYPYEKTNFKSRNLRYVAGIGMKRGMKGRMESK